MKWIKKASQLALTLIIYCLLLIALPHRLQQSVVNSWWIGGLLTIFIYWVILGATMETKDHD